MPEPPSLLQGPRLIVYVTSPLLGLVLAKTRTSGHELGADNETSSLAPSATEAVTASAAARLNFTSEAMVWCWYQGELEKWENSKSEPVLASFLKIDGGGRTIPLRGWLKQKVPKSMFCMLSAQLSSKRWVRVCFYFLCGQGGASSAAREARDVSI